MKKIISLMILLLMVSMVSALTENRKFTTDINITNNGTRLELFTESGSLGPWTCSNRTMVGNPYTNYPINFWEEIEIGDTTHLANITKAMEELAGVSLQLAKYANDSKTFQEKYNEKNEAWARLVENYDDCKEDRDINKNASVQLIACQSDLVNIRIAKNQCNSDLSVCVKDLEDQEASTQTAWIVSFLLGAGGLYLVTNVKKWMPAEKESFQH